MNHPKFVVKPGNNGCITIAIGKSKPETFTAEEARALQGAIAFHRPSLRAGGRVISYHDAAMKLYEQGYSDLKIASSVGVSYTAIQVWRKKNGLVSQTERARAALAAATKSKSKRLPAPQLSASLAETSGRGVYEDAVHHQGHFGGPFGHGQRLADPVV